MKRDRLCNRATVLVIVVSLLFVSSMACTLPQLVLPTPAGEEELPTVEQAPPPCGDGICSEAERMDPDLCPQDCAEQPPPPEEQPPSEGQLEKPEIAFFTADRTNLQPGECATLRWSVEGWVEVVHLNGQPVEPSGERGVCPEETTTYLLEAIAGEPTNMSQSEVVIVVAGAGQTPLPTPTPPPAPTATPTSAPPPPPTPTPTTGAVITVTTPVVFTADLAMTDLRSDKLVNGTVYGSLTNRGPDTLVNVQVQFSCSWVKTAYGATFGLNESIGPRKMTITGPLNLGQTASFNTYITVDVTQYWYDMTCTIQVPFNDPNPANNTYSEKIVKP